MNARGYLIIILSCCLSFAANAQMAQGFYIKGGINVAHPEWSNYNLVMAEYNSLRPWMTTKPNIGNNFMGIHLGYGVSFGNRFYAEMMYMSNRNLMKFEGVNPSGSEEKGTYTLVHRGLTITGGFNLINTSVFRIGLYAGIGAHPVVFRQIGKNFKQTLFTYFLVPIFAMRNNPTSIDEKFYMGTTFGANIQLGGRFGLVFEPFFHYSFWNVNVLSTRDALNVNNPTLYPHDRFKSNLSHWGMKFSFYFGSD